MDTSKEYIEMCYKARELQTKDFITLVIDKDMVGEYDTPFGGVATQLFKQDQLQEIINNVPNAGGQLSMREFLGKGDADTWYPDEYKSWEQLWLAFVMKEKYNKFWNNTEWELINDKT